MAAAYYFLRAEALVRPSRPCCLLWNQTNGLFQIQIIQTLMARVYAGSLQPSGWCATHEFESSSSCRKMSGCYMYAACCLLPGVCFARDHHSKSSILKHATPVHAGDARCRVQCSFSRTCSLCSAVSAHDSHIAIISTNQQLNLRG